MLSLEFIGTSPSSGWIDTAGHSRVTRARREGSSRGAEFGTPDVIAEYNLVAGT